MTDSSAAKHQRKMRLLLLSVTALAASVLLLVPGQHLGEDRPPQAGSKELDGEHLTARDTGSFVEAVARSEAEISPVSGATFLVIDSEGRPVARAHLFPPATPLPTPSPLAASLALTDNAGKAGLRSGDIPSDGVVIWKQGHAPHYLARVEPGESYRVALAQGHRVSIQVVNSRSAAVPGFEICMAVKDMNPEPSMRTRPQAMVVRQEQAGGTAFIGESDSAGRIEFTDVPTGRYLIQCNLGSLPVAVRNPSNWLMLDVPCAPLTMHVQELYGAVVSFEGDEPILVSHGPPRDWPFQFTTGLLNGEPIRRVQTTLVEKFPASYAFVGVASESGSKPLRLWVFGRYGGWSVHELPVVPVESIASPTVVLLPTSPIDQSAEVNVRRVDENGHAIDMKGCRVGFGWRHEGLRFNLECQLGTRVRVPAGAFRLFPAGELPPTAFDPIEGTLSKGERRVIDVKMAESLHRFGVEACVGKRAIPWEWGIRLDGNGAGFSSRFITLRQPRYTFWSTAPKHDVAVFVRGHGRVKGVIERGRGSLEEETGTEVFQIAVIE